MESYPPLCRLESLFLIDPGNPCPLSLSMLGTDNVNELLPVELMLNSMNHEINLIRNCAIILLGCFCMSTFLNVIFLCFNNDTLLARTVVPSVVLFVSTLFFPFSDSYAS